MHNNQKSEEVQYFKELLSPVHGSLYKYIYCIIKNKAQADDVLQNTLLAAYTHIYQLRDECKFKYWIFKIAKHEVFNLIKKSNLETSIDLIDYNLFNIHDEKSNPETSIISKEMKNAVINIINSLDKEARDIVILYYYSELSLKEISKLFNINENTMKSRHRSIKLKIYNKLYTQGLVSELEIKNSLLKLGGVENAQR